jgi:hypothetical protein
MMKKKSHRLIRYHSKIIRNGKKERGKNFNTHAATGCRSFGGLVTEPKSQILHMKREALYFRTYGDNSE